MKLAIITALHKRYGLTRLFLDYYQRLGVPGVELGLFCAVTRGECRMRELVSEHAQWNAAHAVNMPLTLKFAANVANVRNWQPDAMMILGSDDFVDPAYILASLEHMQGADFVGTNTVHYMELGTDQIIRQTVPGPPIGAGRVLSRRLLDYFDWHPWDDDCSALDRSMMNRMQIEGILPETHESGALLDVKSRDQYGQDTNQTTYRTVRKWDHAPVDGHAFLNKHFPQLIEPLLYENSYINRAA